MRPFLLTLTVLTAACAAPRPWIKLDVGQTPETVLGSLGRPDKRYAMVGEKGSLEIWAYSAYSRAFDVSGERHIGTTPRDVPGGGIRDDERARVVFRDGKVVLVETRER